METTAHKRAQRTSAQKRLQRRRRVLGFLSCLVVVATAAALMAPAISMTKEDLDVAPQNGSSSVALETQDEQAAEEAASSSESDAEAPTSTSEAAPDAESAQDAGASEPEETPETEGTAAAATEADASHNDEAQTADPGETAMPAQSFQGELRDKNDAVTLTVTVEAPEGAFPEGASMQVEAVAAKKVKAAVEDTLAQEDAGRLDSLQAVDITFLNADGEELEPAVPINVKFASTKIEQAANGNQLPLVMHVDDAGNAQIVDSLTEEELAARKLQQEKDELYFDADAFSVYTLVYTVSQEADGEITANGNSYVITVTYGDETGIPADAVLDVRELSADSDEYASYIAQAEDALKWDKGAASFGRVFDIAIKESAESDVELQPAEGTSVDVRIELADKANVECSVVHLADTPEVMDLSSSAGDAIEFATNGFSPYAIVSSGAVSNLDGQTFAIINDNTTIKEAVTNKEMYYNDVQHLEATPVHTQTDGGTQYVIGDSVTLWKFTAVPGQSNTYYIQDEDGKYLYIEGNSEEVRMSDNPCPITVARVGNSNQVFISHNGRYLDAWNAGNGIYTDGIGGGIWPNNGTERFTLYNLNQIVQNWASKISLNELVQKRLTENPVKDVVIYTRMENAERTGYDYYAVSSDGSLVKVHDIGDMVSWTSSEAPGNTLKWKFTIHESNGAPNGYFDFQSEATGQYLIPSAQGILKEDDPADNRDLGVNMSGWSATPSDCEYGSAIERWDTGLFSYVGYSYDAGTNKLVPYTGTGKELELFYAVIDGNEPSLQSGLHTVESIAGTGVTVKMYDFNGWQRWNSGLPRSYEMTSVIGGDSISSTNTTINGETVGYANQGLMSQTLDANGNPTATETNTSLGTLFNNAHLKAVANNLFVKRVYDESGYYRYDSSANFAYLDQTHSKFILYREVAGAAMEGATTPSGQKGGFFPYTSLEDLAANNSIFTDRSVQYDGDLNRLPVSHPQYGETLYKVPNDGASNGYANYFFGMTMEANFVQNVDGKDKNGDDTIFEFNGDDDMWLYIDDLLVLDIGGCHGAVSGTINFSTGAVHINRIDKQGNPLNTTLKDLFKNADRLLNGDRWNDAEAEKYFEGNTFADLTQHTFKMFYLERGAYASNLKVSFNLQTIEPGSLVLEKKLPDNVQSAYGNDVFAYQIYTIENGMKKLYTPPTSSPQRYVTYEGTGKRVVPEGQTESAGFKPSYTLNGREYENVYFLKPGEAIVLPVNDMKEKYYVREIGIDTEVFQTVKANDQVLSITTTDATFGATENLSPTNIAATTVATVQERGRVVYENVPKADHVHNLRLKKLVDSPVEDPNATFRFDVNLESNATGQLVPYAQGTYYIVKPNANGVDQYYKYEDGRLVASEGNKPVAYTAGISGSIDNIYPGYTILITGLLAGTDFNVIESMRSGAMPVGYEYVKTEVENAGAAQLDGAQGTIRVPDASSGVQQDALVTITNRPTNKIVVEKNWQSGDFVTAHADVYVALYKKSDQDGEPLTLVEGSLRKLVYDASAQKYRTEYYVPGQIGDYVVREMKVTLNEQGEVASAEPVAEGGTIAFAGETTKDSNSQASVTDSYVVGYEQGETSSYDLTGSTTTGTSQTGATRTDKVTNTMPTVSLYKTNEVTTGTGKRYLAGAVFALEDADGNAVNDAAGHAITFTSNADGMLFQNKRFSDGTYYLHETKAPAGYNLLEHRIILTVQSGNISMKAENPGTALYSDLDTGENSYKFEVQNNPGVELPMTGGPGTTWMYILGTLLVVYSIMYVVRRIKLA